MDNNRERLERVDFVFRILLMVVVGMTLAVAFAILLGWIGFLAILTGCIALIVAYFWEEVKRII